VDQPFEFRVPFPDSSLDPEDYCSVEYVIDPTLRHVGNYVCAETWADLPTAVTQAQRALLAIHGCYCEVANGGFHQFFWNGGSEVVQAALAGFEGAGMVREATLLRRAMALVPGGLATGSRMEVCACLETVDYEQWRQMADPIEEEWYRLSGSPNVIRQLVAFIDSHRPELFVS
jgi:hypothetical protein